MINVLLKLISLRKGKAFPISNGIKCIQKNQGMTYVELIVVLSIFAVLSAVSFYNYGAFQANVDIKNLASDIALQIVQAQKASINGSLPIGYSYDAIAWKPSYGAYFNTAQPKQFSYFVDLNNTGSRTILSTISIVKNNNSILDIKACNDSSCASATPTLSVYFVRPNSDANFLPTLASQGSGYQYFKITVTSPQNKTAVIKIYQSGRIQMN